MAPLNLAATFAVLRPDLHVDSIDNSPTVYQELDRSFDQFRDHARVAWHEFSCSWGNWERHPAGDEIVVLISGAARMILRRADGDEAITLGRAGDFLIVPRNTWHTAELSEPTRMLFVTPGEGTDHTDDPVA